jgi:hypothetical protein
MSLKINKIIMVFLIIILLGWLATIPIWNYSGYGGKTKVNTYIETLLVTGAIEE